MPRLPMAVVACLFVLAPALGLWRRWILQAPNRWA
jgi:hypothetical protein